MTDVTLSCPGDVQVSVDHGDFALKIQPSGWAKILAAGWPNTGQMPVDLTVDATDPSAITVTMHAPKAGN